MHRLITFLFSGFIRYLRGLKSDSKFLLILCSKPSAELFHVFDRLLLLRKGGQTVFMGDIGPNATSLIHYFEMNGSRACKPDENPYVSRQLTEMILMYP